MGRNSEEHFTEVMAHTRLEGLSERKRVFGSGREVSPLGLLALYLHFFVSALKSMERVKGIEPS